VIPGVDIPDIRPHADHPIGCLPIARPLKGAAPGRVADIPLVRWSQWRREVRTRTPGRIRWKVSVSPVTMRTSMPSRRALNVRRTSSGGWHATAAHPDPGRALLVRMPECLVTPDRSFPPKHLLGYYT